jgi:hypothetical protein
LKQHSTSLALQQQLKTNTGSFFKTDAVYKHLVEKLKNSPKQKNGIFG